MTFTVPIPTTSLRHAALALIAAAALVGCGSTKPVPAWQTQTLNTTDAAVTAFLQGQAKVADLLMKQAQFSASSTGRLEAVYKLTLLECALRSASLSVEPCPRPEDVGLLSRAFEDDEWATLAAYRRYLIGERLTPQRKGAGHRDKCVRHAPVEIATDFHARLAEFSRVGQGLVQQDIALCEEKECRS